MLFGAKSFRFVGSGQLVLGLDWVHFVQLYIKQVSSFLDFYGCKKHLRGEGLEMVVVITQGLSNAVLLM